MIKNIDFPPYNRAEVVRILENGDVMCCLYGDDVSDFGIVFPRSSHILSLTEQEVELLLSQQAAE